jgi:hypothetical protein
MGKDLGMAYLVTLSRHFSKMTEETTKNLNQ